MNCPKCNDPNAECVIGTFWRCPTCDAVATAPVPWVPTQAIQHDPKARAMLLNDIQESINRGESGLQLVTGVFMEFDYYPAGMRVVITLTGLGSGQTTHVMGKYDAKAMEHFVTVLAQKLHDEGLEAEYLSRAAPALTPAPQSLKGWGLPCDPRVYAYLLGDIVGATDVTERRLDLTDHCYLSFSYNFTDNDVLIEAYLDGTKIMDRYIDFTAWTQLTEFTEDLAHRMMKAGVDQDYLLGFE